MKNRVSKLIGAGALIAAAALPFGASADGAGHGVGAITTSVTYTSHPGHHRDYWQRGPYDPYSYAPRYYYPRGYWNHPHSWRHHRHHRHWDRDRRHWDRDDRRHDYDRNRRDWNRGWDGRRDRRDD